MRLQDHETDSNRVDVTFFNNEEHKAVVVDGLPLFSLAYLRLHHDAIWSPPEYPASITLKHSELLAAASRLNFLVEKNRCGGKGPTRAICLELGQTISAHYISAEEDALIA